VADTAKHFMLHRRGTRCVTVLAGTVVLALAAAAPSFASEGEEPTPTVPVVLGTVASDDEPTGEAGPELVPVTDDEEMPIPVLDATELEEIVATAQTDPGNIDVSVRVLSPGTDEPATQQTGAPELISPVVEPDITTATDPAAAGPSEETEPPTGSVNTNVSVRVLSPGDNAPVRQTSDLPVAAPKLEGDATDESVTPEDRGDAVPAGAAKPGADAESSAAGTPGDASLSDGNSAGYHEGDSQYQSDDVSPSPPWYWSWSFTIDCAGNASSSSTETGNPSSLDWTWDWAWDWSCTHGSIGPPSPSVSDAGSSSSSTGGNTNVSVRVLSPGDSGSVTQSTGSSGATGTTTNTAPSSGEWSWNWIFTFCGETTSLPTQFDSQTPLSWTWDWTWNWTCDAAVGPPPDLNGSPERVEQPPTPVISPAAPVPVLPDAQAPTVDLMLPAIPSSTGPAATPIVGLPVAIGLDLGALIRALPGLALLQLALPQLALPELALPQLALPSAPHATVDISVIAAAAGASPLPVPTATTPLERGPTAPAHRGWGLPTALPRHDGGGTGAPAATTLPVAAPRPPSSTTSGHGSKASAKRHSVRPAPPRRDRDEPLSLFDGPLSSQASGGLGTSGGLVPSAPLVAIAALIGFFVLAAPGLGRRIRVARELSPRDAYRSSIDHPG
jgi:hypothetical protein